MLPWEKKQQFRRQFAQASNASAASRKQQKPNKDKARRGGSGTQSGRYSGSAGGSTPPGSPLGWYDFSDSANITVVSTEITAVTDKGSGLNDIATFGGSPKGPTQSTSWQNGLNGADFDPVGTSAGLRTGTTNPTGYASGKDWTVAMIGNPGTITNTPYKTVGGWMTGSYSFGWGIMHTSGGGANFLRFGVGSVQSDGPFIQTGTAHGAISILIARFVDSTKAGTVYKNGDTTTPYSSDTLGAGTLNANQGFYLAGDAFAAAPLGQWGEFVIYDNATVDLDELFSYLNTKWAVY